MDARQPLIEQNGVNIIRFSFIYFFQWTRAWFSSLSPTHSPEMNLPTGITLKQLNKNYRHVYSFGEMSLRV